MPAPFTVNPDVIYRELAGEVVLLNLQSGVYYGLDPVGSRVWQLLTEQRSMDDLCAVLLDEFEVSADRLRADVARLVDELAAKGLIARPAAGSSS